MSMNNYVLAFNVGLVGTLLCYTAFFLTGNVYTLGVASLLTFVCIFYPVLVQRTEKAKAVVSSTEDDRPIDESDADSSKEVVK